jgi:hypothetical protein
VRADAGLSAKEREVNPHVSVLLVVVLLSFVASVGCAPVMVRTEDGLALTFDDTGRVVEVSVGGKRLPARIGLAGARPEAGGFWVTPVREPDGSVGERVPVRGRLERVGDAARLSAELVEPAVSVKALLKGGGPYIDVNVEFRATTDQDQAFTVEFVLPLAAEEGWLWEQDLETSLAIEPGKTYANLARLGTRNEIPVNQLPFSALAAGDVGLSLAVPMHSPRVFRTSFEPHGPERPSGYVVAFDLGLTQTTSKFPGRADVRFVIYRNDPGATPRQGAFRSAAQRYYDFFPELYTKRVTNEGSWGHFQKALTTVPGLVEDFAAAFCGTGDVTLKKEEYEAAKALDINVAKHREPWAWWHLVYYLPGYRTDDPSPWRDYFIAIPEGDDRPGQPALEEELALIGRQATAPLEVKDGNDQIPGPLSEVARAAKNCFILDADGNPVRINWHRWTQGWHSQWPLNVDPDIPKPNRKDCARTYQFQNMATWSDPEAYHVNGISWDSLTNWTGFRLEDYNRENFQYVDVPLTFSRKTGRVVAIKGFHDFEMADAWCAEVRAKGRFIRANTDLQPWLFCGQFIEVMGIERSADRVRDSEAALVRVLCYRKPASYYNNVGEAGMRRCLFYGVHPGGLQVLNSPEEAERARPLFKKYAPLIRTIALAGWQPITGAEDRSGTAKVERWGDPKDVTYFTLRTVADAGGTVQLAVNLRALGLGDAKVAVTELVEGREVTSEKSGDYLLLSVPINASETLLLKLTKGE